MGANQNRPTNGEPSAEMCEADHYVLGGGQLGVSIARALRAEGYDAGVVDESCGASDVPSIRADPADVEALERVRLSDASTVIVATRSDSRTLLVAQRVRARFDAPRVLVLANVRDRIDVFAEAGHEPVCATSALADAVVDAV